MTNIEGEFFDSSNIKYIKNIENLYLGLQSGRYVLVNMLDEVITKQSYSRILDFSNGIARVERDKKWGVINLKGDEVIECKYDKVSELNKNGYMITCLGDKYGYINIKDMNVVEPTFELDNIYQKIAVGRS